MRMFLDVGANLGQTAEAVLDPKYGFDRIICFEPDPKCCEELARLHDPRVVINQYGLWKESCELTLYDPGTLGGSIFADKSDIDQSRCTPCRLVRASEWFAANVRATDEVFMKLNCEGSECDIIDDLLDGGEYGKIKFVMIDFDVRKVPSQAHREVEVRERLRAAGWTNYHFENEVMLGGSHAARIQNWLHVVGADRCSLSAKLRQLVYLARLRGELRSALLWGWLRRLVAARSPRLYYWLKMRRHGTA